jgi:hypothetical protein
VCGAGINCVGVAPDGRTARFPSLGRISGDWGGGHQLGEEALWWAVRGEDGRGPRTALQEAVSLHFGLPRVSDVTEALHFSRVPETRLTELTPLLFAVAEEGDDVAAIVAGVHARAGHDVPAHGRAEPAPRPRSPCRAAADAPRAAPAGRRPADRRRALAVRPRRRSRARSVSLPRRSAVNLGR